MEAALGMWPEAIANTVRIADMCNLDLDLTKKHLPGFRTPEGITPEQHLRQLAWEGLARRFGEVEPPPEYRKRLDWELQVIEDKGYSSYFLIVNDFVLFARRNEIPASPRGSGVAHCGLFPGHTRTSTRSATDCVRAIHPTRSGRKTDATSTFASRPRKGHPVRSREDGQRRPDHHVRNPEAAAAIRDVGRC
jgi:hypothetical protein